MEIKYIPTGQFQSTSPVWGMTKYMRSSTHTVVISIHIPRVGDDHEVHRRQRRYVISIHIPRVGDDNPQRSQTAEDL